MVALGQLARLLVAVVVGFAAVAPLAASPEEGVIRLGAGSNSSTAEPDAGDPGDPGGDESRRGFDYSSFESRLESLWFQRKTLLADGRAEDAVEQSRKIRAYCSEEGVRRLEQMAGALMSEAHRYIDEGYYDRAADALTLAEAVDPGRPQTRAARATLYWRSGRGMIAAGTEVLGALRAAVLRALLDLSLFNQLALVLVIGLAGCLLVFSLLMLVRYQVPFRHEIEEFVLQRWNENLARPAGWAMLLLPLLTWVAAGWIAVWWIVITFRFMRRGERVAATALLCASLVAVPAYRLGVTVYGTTADPAVRTTLASAGGEYDPDRVLRLRQLVGAHPYDPVYRFLLAGLFKNGRYFEEAFSEYKAALDIDPTLVSGYINLGNIFYTTGQYAEAVVNYRQALEYEPDSILAYFNLHLAQSEMFRFTEAEETLDHARSIDSAALAEMLALAGTGTDRTAVMDASIGMSSIWEAALGGSRSDRRAPTASGPAMAVARMVNPIGVVSIGALMACLLVLLVGSRSVARRCIRCGGPFCHYCKSGREGQEYCSQCLHLFVLGDGLAHAAKSRKLYDVERYERWVRRSRRLLSLVLPGSAQILRGRALTGCLILLAWLAALVAWQPAALLPLEKVMGLDIGLDLLRPAHVPALYGIDPFAFLALVSLPLLWLTGNLWRLRRREA